MTLAGLGARVRRGRRSRSRCSRASPRPSSCACSTTAAPRRAGALELDEGFIWRGRVDGLACRRRATDSGSMARMTRVAVRAAIPPSCCSTPTPARSPVTVRWDDALGGDNDLTTRRRTCRARSSTRRRVRLERRARGPDTALVDSVIYELHVKGYTKLHPEVPEELRGTYRGPRRTRGDRASARARGDRGRAAARPPVRPRPVPARARAAQLLGLPVDRLLRARTTSTAARTTAAARSRTSRRWSAACTRRDSR